MDVTIIGSMNTDLICYTEKFPSPGETVEGTNFVTGFGGKGANQCVAARKLGANVSLISRVGNDYFGDLYLKYLKSIGVSIDSIKVCQNNSSGVALITVQRTSGENRIVIVPGANNELSSQDFVDAYRRGLVSSKVLLCQFESNAHASLFAMEESRRMGTITILDPAPAPLKDSIFVSLIPRFLAASTIICPNETESSVLTGINIPPFTSCMSPAQIVEATIPWLVSFSESGVSYPIVTLGRNGAVALLPRCDQAITIKPDVFKLDSDLLPEDKTIFLVKAPSELCPVDTTGAGDCFAGTLAFYLSKFPGLSMIEKLRRSVWISSQSVMRCGTQSSFFDLDELPQSLFDDNSLFVWPSNL